MKPFDLERALAGEPVNVIGDTAPRRVIAKSAYHDNRYIVESECGACTRKLETLQNDFEMWQEPRPRVQLDLPAPLKDVQQGQRVYFLNLGNFLRSVSSLTYNQNRTFDYELFKNGGLFATKQDAQEWLDAMRNARR